MIWLSWVLCNVGHFWVLCNVGHLMPNPLITYIRNIYDVVWLGFMAYQLM